MAGLEALIRCAARNCKAKGGLSFLVHRLTSTSAVKPSPLPFLLRASPLSSPSSSSPSSSSSRSRLFSPPLSGLAAGPLFLSSPAWKLSQSATPLHFQGKAEILKPPKVVPPARSVGAGVRSGGVVEVWNLPNLISISRMISGPFIGWMIINEWYFTSFVTLAISGMTDWLDGFAARRMNINSVLGSYLDPLADKVLIGFVAVAMVKKDLLHSGLVLLLVIRDVGLIGGAIYKRASILGWQWTSWSEFVNLNATRPQKVEPLFISKVNTVFQLILVAAALLQPEFGSENTEWYITYLTWLVASTTVASSVAYGVQHLRTLASVNAR